MKTNLIKTIWVALLLMNTTLGFSDPNWTVNSASFSLDFSMIVRPNYNGIYASSTNDIVAAFDRNGNCRGVGELQFDSQLHMYVATFTVLGNLVGDSIFLKMYNSIEDSIYTPINAPIIFTPNVLIGEYFSPYVISNVNLPTDLRVETAPFMDTVSIGTEVGHFVTNFPVDSLANPTYQLVSGNGDSDNSRFYLDSNQLFTNITFDFDMDSIFSIRVSVTNQGFAIEQIFEITIMDSYVASLNDIKNNPIKAFPNPTTKFLTISLGLDLKGPSVVRIHNLMGQQVFTTLLTTTPFTMDLGMLPSGTYFLTTEQNTNPTIIVVE